MSIESGPEKVKRENLPSAEELKEKLLSGILGGAEFLVGLNALDQLTPERVDAIKNVEILTEPEVIDFFSNHPENRNLYYYDLAFAYLHRGQIEIMDEQNREKAFESFRAALSSIHNIDTPDEREQAFKDYIDGHVAYFEGDLEKLKKIHQNMREEGRNRFILESFIDQLESGSKFDYRAAIIAAKREHGYKAPGQ